MIAGGYSNPNRKRISRLLLTALAVSAANPLADLGSGRRSGSPPPPFPPILFVQTPKISGVMGVERFPEGSRIVLLAPETKGKAPVNLTDGFFAAADPQVDFTGKRMLFAAQKSRGDPWQIWEMNLDATAARQITKCVADCVRPAYLPADEIVFTSVLAEAGRQHSSLQVIGRDGSNVHAITFGPGDWWLEMVLRDGRIVASANAPLQESSSAGTNRLLYTLRPDGTGLETLRCEHSNRASRGEAGELEDGAIVFTENTGALMLVKRGALHEEKTGLPGVSYRSPNPLPNDSIVVAQKSRHDSRYQLFLLSADGHGQARAIYSDTKFDSLEPVAVQTKSVPKKFWSNLIPNSSTGYFISLDSSNSMDSAKNSAPIRRVRVVAQKRPGEVVLGEAPVEPDGSFYVQVPANQAVRFVLLDEQGRVIREEQSWVWTRPGEERGCTGCHGDKALAPENRWPMALKRQDSASNLGNPSGYGQTVEGHDH
jgi:Hydrazine synthase alpha subunit middle domain